MSVVGCSGTLFCIIVVFITELGLAEHPSPGMLLSTVSEGKESTAAPAHVLEASPRTIDSLLPSFIDQRNDSNMAEYVILSFRV